MGATGQRIDRIEEKFAARFAHWSVKLPVGSAARREGGHIFEKGWHIGYIWGEEDGEEYLEGLAQHRMTDDSRVRMWASGCEDFLPAPSGMIVIPREATETEIKQLEGDSAERNRTLYGELRDRGLLPPEGGNLGAMEINEFLTSGGMADADESQS